MWILDTNQINAFEANSLRELCNDVARYYAKNDETICHIERVYFENGNGINPTLSEKGLNEFVEECEEFNALLRNEFVEEIDYSNQVQSEFYSNII
jgi:hypothetical protein